MTAPPGRRGDLSDRLVGTWRLVSYTGQGADGRETHEYGLNPRGRLIYDKGGHMSVHLADPRRKPFVSGDPLRATAEELKDAFAGYFGYFGTYTVDEKAGVVTHHVEEASYPNFAGTDQRRFLNLQGSRLILRTAPVLAGGAEVTYIATWEREA